MAQRNERAGPRGQRAAYEQPPLNGQVAASGDATPSCGLVRPGFFEDGIRRAFPLGEGDSLRPDSAREVADLNVCLVPPVLPACTRGGREFDGS